MKKCIVAVTLLLTLNGSAFALTDREYYDMKKDPFFRAADRKLTMLLRDMKPIMPEKDFAELTHSHEQWLALSRDQRAGELIAGSNLAKVDAYVQATNQRIKYIEGIRKQYIPEPEPEPEPELPPETSKLAKSESRPESHDIQPQPEPEPEPREPLTRRQAQDLLERELKARGLWSSNNVLTLDDDDKESRGRFTLHDDENNKDEICWHFVHGMEYPEYISAINDYYVNMDDGTIYVLDTFDDVVRPIDETEL